MRSQGWSQLCHPPRHPIPLGRTQLPLVGTRGLGHRAEEMRVVFPPQDGPGGFAGEVWALGRGWRREGVLQGATPLGLGGREPPRCHYLERLGNHFGKVRAERAQLPESFHLAHLDQDPAKQEASVRPSTGPSEPAPLPQETLPKQTFSSQQNLPRAALGEGPDRRSVTAVRCPAAWKGGGGEGMGAKRALTGFSSSFQPCPCWWSSTTTPHAALTAAGTAASPWTSRRRGGR